MRAHLVLPILGIFFVLTNAAIWFFGAGRDRPWSFAVCCLSGFVVMFLARTLAPRQESRLPAVVLAAAVAARLVAFASPSLLSDDVHRYLWDGKLVAAGVNPYDYRPLDPALEGFRDEHYDRMNSRHWYSVYPPLAQLFFAAAWKALGPSVSAWKSVALLLDLLALLLLGLLVRELESGWGNFLYYAWNPLVIWEGAGNGHTEGILIPLAVLSVLLWRRRRSASAVCWGLAILAKLTPALGLFWIFRKSRRAGALSVVTFALGGLILFRPWNIGHVFDSLERYWSLFAFNSALYLLAAKASYVLGSYWAQNVGLGMLVLFILLFFRLVRRIPAGVNRRPSDSRSQVPSGAAPMSPLSENEAADGPASRDTRREFVAFLQAAFLLHLVLSSVIHPWYFMAIAWTLPVRPRPSLLWLNVALPFSYTAYASSPPQDLTVVLCLEYIPFALLWIREMAAGQWRLSA